MLQNLKGQIQTLALKTVSCMYHPRGGFFSVDHRMIPCTIFLLGEYGSVFKAVTEALLCGSVPFILVHVDGKYCT